MGRLRGCLWLTAGLVVALLAGFVGFMTLSKAQAQRGAGAEKAAPTVAVVVAKRAVAVRSTLTTDDVEVKNVPVDAAPEGALTETSQAIGKVTLVDLYPQETLLLQRLIDPNVTAANGRTALLLAEDQVLVALPVSDLMSKAGVLKPGDHVDLLFSFKFPANRGLPQATTAFAAANNAANRDELVAFDTLQNVTISAMVAGKTGTGSSSSGNAQNAAAGAPDGLLLTLTPQDALVVKYMQDAGATLSLVLRAPQSEQPFTTEPVDVDYIINKYRIPVQVGK